METEWKPGPRKDPAKNWNCRNIESGCSLSIQLGNESTKKTVPWISHLHHLAVSEGLVVAIGSALSIPSMDLALWQNISHMILQTFILGSSESWVMSAGCMYLHANTRSTKPQLWILAGWVPWFYAITPKLVSGKRITVLHGVNVKLKAQAVNCHLWRWKLTEMHCVETLYRGAVFTTFQPLDMLVC